MRIEFSRRKRNGERFKIEIDVDLLGDWRVAVVLVQETVTLLSRKYEVLKTSLSDDTKVERPPGSTALNWSRKIFPKKFVRDVLEPTVMDLQDEYLEALASSGKAHRRWVYLRGHLSFLLAVVVGLKVGVVKKFVDVWKML
ncbi:MAG: hypothetical protein AAFY34_09265 [Pseudomonadota bacterium]